MSDHLTKTRILEAAEELLLEKSFQSVSLNEILTAVKISKGLAASLSSIMPKTVRI
jgi:TetR/AcrR family transcriptional repressor of nem operon